MSVRTWIARGLMGAAARVLAGQSAPVEPEPEDVDELPPGPVVARTAEAQRMIAEAEEWRIEREAARAKQKTASEAPPPGSLLARIEAARARNNP